MPSQASNFPEHPGVNVFVSYAHKDEAYKDELIKHLSPLEKNGLIKSWNDRAIIPGEEWDKQIKTALEAAHVFVLLVSPDFLSSDYITDVEISKAFERYYRGEVTIVPVIIRPCRFQNSPIGKIQALPKDAVAVSKWADADDAYFDIMQGIEKAINSLLELGGPQSPQANLDRSIAAVPFAALTADLEDISDPGLKLIDAVNREARRIYRNRILKQAPPAAEKRFPDIWRGFWLERDFDAQRHFVETRITGSGEYAHHKIRRELSEGFLRKKEDLRIWIVGEAGVGKTTILYRTYFGILETDEGDYPRPLLLQPGEFDVNDTERLLRCDTTEQFMKTVLQIWLEKRNITFASLDERNQMLKLLISHLIDGRICLLIDGYDEISRMQLQREMFQTIFKTAALYVCASRPESYVENIDNITIVLKPTWDVPTVRQYLQSRLLQNRNVVDPFVKFISENNNVEWLRNPRYLDLFVSTLNANTQLGELSPTALLELIRKGEYNVFNQIYILSYRRLHRLAAGKRIKLSEPLVRERLLQVAVQQLKHGSLLLKEADIDPIWEIVCEARGLLSRLPDVEGTRISLLNQNLVDFFLAAEIARRVYTLNEQLSYNFLWSDSLLTYLGQEFMQKHQYDLTLLAQEIWRKLAQYRIHTPLPERGYRTQADLEAPQDGFFALNLMQLLIGIEIEAAKSGRHDKMLGDDVARKSLVISGRELNDLYLPGIDLHDITFQNCDFSGSILTRANLEESIFEDCDLREVNFQHASANWAKFSDCRFSFHEYDPGGQCGRATAFSGRQAGVLR